MMDGFLKGKREAIKYSSVGQKKRIVVIPEHGKADTKTGTLNSILKQAGLK